MDKYINKARFMLFGMDDEDGGNRHQKAIYYR